MKKLLLAFFVFLAGCSSIKEMEREIQVRGWDYRPFSEQGFLMTPEMYQGDYESVGSLYVTLWPEVTRTGQELRPGTKYLEYDSPSGGVRKWLVEVVDGSEVLQQVYETATEMGADALVNMRLNVVTQQNGELEVKGLEVEGFAIRRQ